MTRRLAMPVLALACLSVTGPAARAETLAGPVAARVERVVDGDTLRVRARVWIGHEVAVAVRLRGVDAPEIRARCEAERRAAVRARDHVERAVAGGPVVLTRIEGGKFFGRVVADVSAAGDDLAAGLLAAGLARPYAGGRRAGWCATAEARR